MNTSEAILTTEYPKPSLIQADYHRGSESVEVFNKTSGMDTSDPDNIDEISPYQMITMLLQGALNRIDSAIIALSDGEQQEADALIAKTIAIVDALKENLDKDKGGDIASNLDLLYEYVVEQLHAIDCQNSNQSIDVLHEAFTLIDKVYSGWIGISDKVH